MIQIMKAQHYKKIPIVMQDKVSMIFSHSRHNFNRFPQDVKAAFLNQSKLQPIDICSFPLQDRFDQSNRLENNVVGNEQKAFYLKSFITPSQKIESMKQKQRSQAIFQKKSQKRVNFFQSKEQFNQFCAQLSHSDLAYLRSNQKKICGTLNMLIDYWHIFHIEYQPAVRRFLTIMETKFFSMPYTMFICRKVKELVLRLKELTSYHCNTEGQMKQTDLLFHHFVKDRESSKSRKGLYYIERPGTKSTLTVNEFIEQTPQFYQNSEWQKIFTLTNHFIEKKEREQQKDREENKNGNNQFEHFYKIKPMNTKNLRNAKFYYANQNIYDTEVNDCKIGLCGRIKDIGNDSSDELFLRELVGLLNTGGGIILWDCRRSYLQVLPLGQLLVQSEKLYIRKKIKQLIKRVSPAIVLGVECILDFIPVAQYPSLYCESSTNELNFREGYYISVLKVFSSSIKLKTKLYSFKQSLKNEQSKSFLESQEIFQFHKNLLGNIGLLSQMKQQLQKYLNFQQLKYQSASLWQRPFIAHSSLNLITDQNEKNANDKDLLAQKIENNEAILINNNEEKAAENYVASFKSRLFFPILCRHKYYQEYTQKIETLNQKYQQILSEEEQLNHLASFLCEQNHNCDLNLDNQVLYKLKKIQLTSTSLIYTVKDNINTVIARYFQKKKQSTKENQKYQKLLKYSPFILLEFLLKKLKILTQQLQKVNTLIAQQKADKKQCCFQNHDSFLLKSLQIYEKQLNILEEYRCIIIELWKNQFYFQSQLLKLQPPLTGKPIRQKQLLKKQINKEPQKKFALASALISQRAHFETIQQILQNKYNFQCSITLLPDTKKFKAVSNSCIIYHNCSHSQLIATIRNNKDFQFNNKAVIINSVSRFIKLIGKTRCNQLGIEQFLQYTACLEMFFKSKNPKLFQFLTRKGEIEFYLSTDQMISTFFLFLVLRHYGEKAVMKNPEGIESPAQSHKDLILIYPK